MDKEMVQPGPGQAVSSPLIDGRPLSVLDLFSGIGGFSLGLERAGFETVQFCEISPKCRHLLSHHWPKVPVHDDVRTLTASKVARRVNVLCGGFPCQDISLAGKGAGITGARSGLWSEYARLIGEFRPRFVIVENVSALLVRGMGTVLGDLAALGYDAWWDCIPASAVGAPHRRDRLWIIAYPRGQQYQGFGDALRRSIAAELLEAAVANTCISGWPEEQRNLHGGESHTVGSGAEVANATRSGRDEGHPNPRGGGAGTCEAWQWPRSPNGSWWSAEPNVGRVANGIPARAHRLHGLGNAVVPEIPYLLGRAILSAISLQAKAA